MLASIVLATFLCTTDNSNMDHCQVSYESIWQDVNDYHHDRDACLTLLNALFPNDDVVNDPVNPKKFTFASCYRVLPGNYVGWHNDSVYLQNVQDADDNFFDKMNKLSFKE